MILVGDHGKIDHPLDFVDVIEMEFPGGSTGCLGLACAECQEPRV